MSNETKNEVAVPDQIKAEIEARAKKAGLEISGLLGRADKEFLKGYYFMNINETLDGFRAYLQNYIDGLVAWTEEVRLCLYMDIKIGDEGGVGVWLQSFRADATTITTTSSETKAAT